MLRTDQAERYSLIHRFEGGEPQDLIGLVFFF